MSFEILEVILVHKFVNEAAFTVHVTINLQVNKAVCWIFTSEAEWEAGRCTSPCHHEMAAGAHCLLLKDIGAILLFFPVIKLCQIVELFTPTVPTLFFF